MGDALEFASRYTRILLMRRHAHCAILAHKAFSIDKACAFYLVFLFQFALVLFATGCVSDDFHFFLNVASIALIFWYSNYRNERNKNALARWQGLENLLVLTASEMPRVRESYLLNLEEQQRYLTEKYPISVERFKIELEKQNL